jgi:hypothetical protein
MPEIEEVHVGCQQPAVSVQRVRGKVYPSDLILSTFSAQWWSLRLSSTVSKGCSTHQKLGALHLNPTDTITNSVEQHPVSLSGGDP